MTRESVAALDSVEALISPSEFVLFQNLILTRAGIRLNGSKRALLVGRLFKRVRDLGLRSFNDYYRKVIADADEHTRMLDLITTNETAFFREPHQFAYLEHDALPRWTREADAGRRDRALSVWSAGCSTGEEPYSVAMLLHARCPGWKIDIVATDLSTRVLETAERGIWPAEKLANIPAAYRRPYILKGIGSQAGSIRVVDALRSLVRFHRVNLIDPHDGLHGPFDIVLCRNVMIYFDPATRRAVVDRLIDRIAIGGYFLLGHAEALSGFSSRVSSVRPSIWMRKS